MVHAVKREASLSRGLLRRNAQVEDQLVQFRSLTDIVSIKRTLGGAFSVFGRRRVFRGIPVKQGIVGTGPSEARAGVSTSPVTTPVDSTGVPATTNCTMKAGGDPAVTAGSLSAPISAADADTGTDVGAGTGAEEPGLGFDDDLDDHVEHLVLVVHGIGDALMSVDLGVVQLGSLVECCDTMRAHHQEVGDAAVVRRMCSFSREVQRASREAAHVPRCMGRGTPILATGFQILDESLLVTSTSWSSYSRPH